MKYSDLNALGQAYRRRVDADPDAPGAPRGRCPVCGEVDLMLGNLIDAHGVTSMSWTPCRGSGQRPRRGQRDLALS